VRWWKATQREVRGKGGRKEMDSFQALTPSGSRDFPRRWRESARQNGTDLHLEVMSSEPRDIKERSFEFAIQIVALCRDLEESPRVAGALAQQLLRCGTAIGARVEDAHGNHAKQDFIARMATATQEARETKYWLRLLSAVEAVPHSRVADLIDEASQLIAILTTIVKRSRENAQMSPT